MPRLFTGLTIPPDIADQLSVLRGGLVGARWIDPENYHVTLRYIGDVSAALARELDQEFARVRRPPLDLVLERLSAFGHDKPRAIVVRIGNSLPLALLQADHERAARHVGLAPDTRKFTPHVTLARSRGASAVAAADYLQSRNWFRSALFHADRFVLFSSRASTGGGPYLVEAEYPLDAAAAASLASRDR
jgi:2'-5' RNA ligase